MKTWPANLSRRTGYKRCLTELLFAFFGLVLLLLGDRMELFWGCGSRGDDSAADVAFEAVGFGYRLAGGQ